MKHYSRLAKKVVRSYLRSDILRDKINPSLEYKLIRRQFKKCFYCYIVNKEKYGKNRVERIKLLKSKWKSTKR